MIATEWQTIVVGVDASPEALHAARFAVALADRARARVRLVHVAPEVWSLSAPPVAGALRGHVPEAIIEAMDLEVGRPGRTLARTALELQAGLIVVGGMHHTALRRWVAGSTAHAVVRTSPVPVLVTTGDLLPHRRVLCAIDLSDAAVPTIRAAERWADLLGARLTVLHAIEPLALFAEVPFSISPEEYRARVEEELALHVWPHVGPGVERLVRMGEPERMIGEEVARHGADLVVVGSHGKGWIDRVLIGSVTERLLGALPAPLLVVPIQGASAARGLRDRLARGVLAR